MEELVKRTEVSARGVQRLLRVARTLADMKEQDMIGEKELLEASAYKVVSQKYWGSANAYDEER